jgi:cell division protease FtsH
MIMMGGRAAEEIIFNEITTGAANDFDQATSIAKAMVVEYGMSSLGPINFGPSFDVTEIGRNYYDENKISQSMLSKIDEEIKKIITDAYEGSKNILIKNKSYLKKVADKLVEKESLDEDEFEAIVGKKKQKK